MFQLDSYLLGLGVILVFGLLGWGLSLWRRDVSIVDSLWSLMFLLAACSYLVHSPQWSARALLTTALVAVWAIRLSGYITWRNWGAGEDYRYQAIRRNNEPNFALKSLYIVFGLQGILAWIISLPLLAAITGESPIGWLDFAGMSLWIVGMAFEAGGDFQLARFRSKAANRGRVLDHGLWRYTRHPNYFGDFCVWWSFYLLAVSAGGWWSIVSPLLMTVLLLKVSGVSLLEKAMTERRPSYVDYASRTNAFFPGPPKTVGHQH